jgi:hypothetical protein
MQGPLKTGFTVVVVMVVVMVVMMVVVVVLVLLLLLLLVVVVVVVIKFDDCGVYKLTCVDFQKAYVGQTERPFNARFKEHKFDYRSNNQKSNFAKHLLDHGHAWHSIEDIMTVLHSANKGRMLNTLERFYIYAESKKQNQINDQHTVFPNPIFDKLLQPPRPPP